MLQQGLMEHKRMTYCKHARSKLVHPAAFMDIRRVAKDTLRM